MASAEKPSASRSLGGWAVLALPLLTFALLAIYPFFRGLSLSFTKWNIMREPLFVGLENYQRLLRDPYFFKALANTLFSPRLVLRALLLAAFPLSLAVLLMQLRSGIRVSIHAILSPVIFFSGSILTSLLYTIYYSPQGLAGRIFPAPGSGALSLTDPGQAAAIIGNLLTANGLAYSLPLGIAFFLAMARGSGALSPDEGLRLDRLWARSPWMILVSLFGAFGFALSGLEGAYALAQPMNAGDTLITYSFKRAFLEMNFGTGAAAIQFVAVPLLILGLGFIIAAEGSRSRVSISILPRLKGKAAAISAWKGGRVAVTAASGVLALVCVVQLISLCVLPLLGSVAGPAPEGSLSGIASPFLSAFLVSTATAAVSSLAACAFAATAGFGLGFLSPRGSKAALIVVGSFVFLGPAILLIPQFLSFLDLGLMNKLSSLVLPSMASPLGVILFTWFFRGARENANEALAKVAPQERSAFRGRMWGSFALFSLPVLALFFLLSLNMTLVPITTISKTSLHTLPLFLRQTMYSWADGAPGVQSQMARLALLQYLIPLALLVASVIAVFPRLALIVRRKGEEAPATAVNEAPSSAAPVELLLGQSRLSRGGYWKRWLIMIPISLAVTALQYGGNEALALLAAAGSLAASIYMIVQGVRRMHDVDRRGWFIIVPFYDLVLLLRDGTPGPNRFGEDPKGRNAVPTAPRSSADAQ